MKMINTIFSCCGWEGGEGGGKGEGLREDPNLSLVLPYILSSCPFFLGHLPLALS